MYDVFPLIFLVKMSKKTTEWTFGSDHDDLVLQALKRKSTDGPGIISKDLEPVHSDTAAKDLADRLVDLIENNFDSYFDCFQQFDVCGTGRLSKVDFQDGIRTLSKYFKSVPDSFIDTLFDAIDSDKHGEIKLQEFISFFKNRSYKKSRAVVKSGSLAMPVSTGLKLDTARHDLIACDSKFKNQALSKRVVSYPKHQFRPFKLLARAKSRHSSETSRLLTPPDFEQKNKWIDKMIEQLDLPQQHEIATLDGKWDKFLCECRLLDAFKTKQISAEGFRNAMTRTEPRLAPNQIEWYLKGADKSEAGEVLYELFASRRNNPAHKMQHRNDFKSLYAESQIRAKLKINYSNVKLAFKHMDVDRDGRLSKREFVSMLGKLKMDLKPRIIDAIFTRADPNCDGLIEYQDFIRNFSTQSQISSTIISDDEISKQLLERYSNISEIFRAIDKDGDGSISTEEFCEALLAANIVDSPHLDRAVSYASNIDQDGNGIIDFRDFVRYFSNEKFSHLKSSDVHVQKWIERICEKLCEKFDDSKQAFHAFDRSFSCRLSIDDFIAGSQKYVLTKTESASSEVLQDLEKVFSSVDVNGDGFMDYHDFVTKFKIKRKRFIHGSIDSDIRNLLRSKFPASITEAFHALDLDQDNRLSRDDFRQGLSKIGKIISDSELDFLMRRSDLDHDSFVDYDEFILRFGLEAEQPGRWVYKVEEPPPPSLVEKEHAGIFKAHMHGSKWWGRGGIIHFLSRFDGNLDGKLECREGQHEFKAALVDTRDGLGMAGLTDDYIAALLGGAKMDKPYCIPATCSLDIQKFGTFFVDLHFDREKEFFKLLLVENKWLDLMDACDSMSTVSGNQRLISKADLASCLQVLVDQGTIRAEDRKVVIDTCIGEELFIKEGMFAGFLDYVQNLFDRFIGVERQIHGLIFPIWQDLYSEMLRMGGEVNYFQFEDICKPFLSSDQIAWLIDVMDSNNDGHISCDEFVRRYAREEDQLARAVKANWMPTLSLLQQACRGYSSHSDHLPPAALEATLIKAIRDGYLEGVSWEIIPRLIKSVGKELLSESGDVDCRAWICRYAGHRFRINEALEQRQKNGLPLWDAILAEFEQFSACHLEDFDVEPADGHLISREHLRAIFRKHGVVLGAGEEQATLMDSFLMDLDPELSGVIDWVKLVHGLGISAHFFFTSKTVRGVRLTLRYWWKEVVQRCAAMERAYQSSSGQERLQDLELVVYGQGGGPLQGLVQLSDFRRCVEALRLDKISSCSEVFDADECSKIKTGICNCAEVAFCSGGRGVTHIKYWDLVRHYAADEVRAEIQLVGQSDALLAIILSIASNSGTGQISIDRLWDELRQPGGVGQPEVVLQSLVGGVAKVAGGMVDLAETLWRCGGAALAGVLERTWYALYSAFRAADPLRFGRIPLSAMAACLRRSDVGLSGVQADMVERLLEADEDKRVDYRAMLSGSGLAGAGEYRNLAFEAWLCLESDAGWACIDHGLTQATSRGNAAAGGILYSEDTGYGVRAGLIRVWLLGAQQQQPEFARLTPRGLDQCLELLQSASAGLKGTGNMDKDTVLLDVATWLVCGDKLRFDLVVRDSGRLSSAVMETIRAEMEAAWDREAERRGLDGYAPRDSIGRDGPDEAWGLAPAVAERCVAKALSGVGWVQPLHVAALVRRARRAVAWEEGEDEIVPLTVAQDSEESGRGASAGDAGRVWPAGRGAPLITAAGMAAALRSLSVPVGPLMQLAMARGLAVDGRSGASSMRAASPASPTGARDGLDAAETMSAWLCAATGVAGPDLDGEVSRELRDAVAAALEAARQPDEWYLPEGTRGGPQAGRDAGGAEGARRTAAKLAGCCVLDGAGGIWPQALSRRHMRAVLLRAAGGETEPGCGGDVSCSVRDEAASVLERPPSARDAAGPEAQQRGASQGADHGAGGDRPAWVKGAAALCEVAARRGSALYASPAWRSLCDSGARRAEPVHAGPRSDGGDEVRQRPGPGSAGPAIGCTSADLRRLAEERRRSGVYDRIQELRQRRGAGAAPAARTVEPARSRAATRSDEVSGADRYGGRGRERGHGAEYPCGAGAEAPEFMAAGWREAAEKGVSGGGGRDLAAGRSGGGAGLANGRAVWGRDAGDRRNVWDVGDQDRHREAGGQRSAGGEKRAAGNVTTRQEGVGRDLLPLYQDTLLQLQALLRPT